MKSSLLLKKSLVTLRTSVDMLKENYGRFLVELAFYTVPRVHVMNNRNCVIS